MEEQQARRLEALAEEVRKRWESGEWPHLAIAPDPCGICPGATVMVVGLVHGRLGPPDLVARRIRDVFAEFGIDRVHVTCILKAGAPGYEPTEQEIEAFLPYLREEVVIVSPRILVPIGPTAAHIITNYLAMHIPVFPISEPSPDFLDNTDPAFRRQVWSLARFMGYVHY